MPKSSLDAELMIRTGKGGSTEKGEMNMVFIETSMYMHELSMEGSFD